MQLWSDGPLGIRNCRNEGRTENGPSVRNGRGFKAGIDGKRESDETGFKKRDQFAPELVYFSDCVLKDKEPEPSGEEGLADARVIQAVLRSAETSRVVEIPQTKIERRPQPEQEISKEVVENPPKLVKAAAPGRH